MLSALALGKPKHGSKNVKKKIKINQKQKTHENKCIKLHLKLIKIVDKHLR